MQKDVYERGKRNVAVRFALSKGDKDQITFWNQKLDEFLDLFQVRSIGSVGNPIT
jgi:hypothetical protein